LTYHRPLFTAGVYAPQMILFFASFALLIAVRNKVRFSYLVFSFCYLLVSYSASALLSGARYVSGLFPLYLFLAVCLSRLGENRRMYVDWGMLFLLIVYTCIFGLNHVF
jgi:hypothetical protein